MIDHSNADDLKNRTIRKEVSNFSHSLHLMSGCHDIHVCITDFFLNVKIAHLSLSMTILINWMLREVYFVIINISILIIYTIFFIFYFLF
jgi:hypothetical protein